MFSNEYEKKFNDFLNDIRSDFQYLGLYMFVLYKNHRQIEFLSDDVVEFIKRAFDSNSINFDKLLFKYDLLREYFNLTDK